MTRKYGAVNSAKSFGDSCFIVPHCPLSVSQLNVFIAVRWLLWRSHFTYCFFPGCLLFISLLVLLLQSFCWPFISQYLLFI